MFRQTAVIVVAVALAAPVHAQQRTEQRKPVVIEARGRAPIIKYFDLARVQAEADARRNFLTMLGHVRVKGVSVLEATSGNQVLTDAVEAYARMVPVTDRRLWVDKHYAEARIVATIGKDFYALFDSLRVTTQTQR
jgi:hypothetical protein